MKKRFGLIIAVVLTAVLLCACTAMIYVQPPKDQVGTQTPEEEETGTQAAGAGIDMITLEDIAALNGCSVEELNTVFDESGNLTFIGNKIADMTITNSDEASDCIVRLSDLISKEDVAFKYYTVNTSPETGIAYYTFVQTAKGEAAGVKNLAVEFFCNTLKLAVDKNGCPVAMSAYVNHSTGKESTFITITGQQAVDTVLGKYPDAHIYPENTILTYWNDRSSEAVSAGAKISLVWVVYADDSAEKNTGTEGELQEETPEALDCAGYTAFIVSAKDEGDGTGKILAVLSTANMTDYRTETANTADTYFDEFEDAGTYTYTVNFDWMSDTDREYSVNYVGTDSMTVTVPVMRNLEDGLYYLGEKEHHIFMSNFYDFTSSEGDVRKFNPYVTDNPEQLDSWHFQTASVPATGRTYFDDPDYVLASFAQYVKTIYSFSEKFSLFEMYPEDAFLLTTYTFTAASDYPEDASTFDYNAANLGKYYDWTVFMTSPVMGLCLDAKVMAHEYTHAVNMHFSNALYMNEQGALMESYADVIGYYAAIMDEPQLDNWYVGGSFGPVLRCLKEPGSFDQPKYKGGINYVNAIDAALNLNSAYDHGGVHTNSGVPNYLGYLMTQGQPQDDTEEVLTNEETLYLWYETLFLGTYHTDFKDQCAYFRFAADVLGLSPEQKNFINRLTGELGMENGQASEELLNSEESKKIRVTLRYEDDATAESYKMGVVIWNVDENMKSLGRVNLGGFADGDTLELRVRKDLDYNLLDLSSCTGDGRMFHGLAYLAGNEPEMEFTVMYRNVDAEEGFRIAKEETIKNPDGFSELTVSTDEATGETVLTTEKAVNCLVITKTDGASDGAYNVYILSMTPSEVEGKTEDIAA